MWYSLRRSAGFARRGWLCQTADARRQTADAYRQTCEWWYMVEWRALHHPRLLVRQCEARQRACCIGDCSGDGASWSGERCHSKLTDSSMGRRWTREHAAAAAVAATAGLGERRGAQRWRVQRCTLHTQRPQQTTRSSWLVGGRHASSPWVSAVAVGLGGSQCIANAARQLACIVGVSSSLPYASAAHGPITW